MPTQQSTARAAIRLSVVGSVLVVLDFGLDFITYIRASDFGYADWALSIGAFLSCFWPFLGCLAMRHTKGSHLFCCFAVGNYLSSIVEVIMQLALFIVLFAVVRMQMLTEQCDSKQELLTTCSEDTRRRMQELCTVLEVLYFNGSIANTSAAFGEHTTSASWSSDMEDICIHRAHLATTIGFVACGIASTTRCCAIAAHCRAGYLGSELSFAWGNKASSVEDDWPTEHDVESSLSS